MLSRLLMYVKGKKQYFIVCTQFNYELKQYMCPCSTMMLQRNRHDHDHDHDRRYDPSSLLPVSM